MNVIKEIKIGYIKRTEKIAKTGKNKGGKFVSVGIKPEGSERWINGYGAKSNEDWKEGDTVSLEIETKVVDGRTFYNFKNPSGKINQEDFIALVDRVTRLELELSSIKSNLGLGNGQVVEGVEENLPI